ncbi:carbohydrate ABC transporter permease [Paenibacillus lignilyticus]|uniref:Carbohydrate ABC transporter permease n=1 Tax=Paenibacillus lignilyticus TaxID=1172615 RepID=A0ABS5CFZ4_9BACL|nr:carbohydrate ABC transporter permease [Paenibacillus lignilyticus]MBP3964756.1 carbohydrate ABC transporter permease [Paenibacillus lignilyticus]
MIFDRKDLLGRTVVQIVIVMMGILWLYPLVRMVLKSFEGGFVNNYSAVFLDAGVYRYFWNSIVVAAMDIALTITCVTLAAYAFSRLRFPLQIPLFLILIIGMMIPGAGFIIPWFLTIKKLGLVDNPLSLVGPHVAGGIPFGLMLIRSFFDGIPKEINEAATIDGASKHTIFRRIYLPLGMPAIATVTIYTFLGSWNDYLLPLIFLQDPASMTVTLLPQKFVVFAGSNYGKISAALMAISIPIFLVYFFCQRFLEKGLTAGSVK